MSYELNGKEVSQKELLDYIEDEDTIVTDLSVEIPNDKYDPTKPTTMEGFDIKAEYLVSLAKTADENEASVTVTLRNCGKLGGKTVVITVKDADHDEKQIGLLGKLFRKLNPFKS